MAQGGDTRWQKGQSGNPGGRVKMPKHIVDFKRLTYQEFLDYLQKYGSMAKEDMEKELKRPGATMFELIFGKVILSAAQGDKDARRELFERLWGKVKEQTDLTVTNLDEKLDKVPREQIIQLLKAANE